MKINFQETTAFKTYIKEGFHKVKCISAEVKTSDKTGNTYIEFDFSNGQSNIKHINSIDGKDQNYYLRLTLNALNFEIEKLIDNEGNADIKFEYCVDKICIVKVVPEEYYWKGEPKTRGRIEILFKSDDPIGLDLLENYDPNKAQIKSNKRNELPEDLPY